MKPNNEKLKMDSFKFGTQIVTSTIAAKAVTALLLPPGTKFLGVALVNVGSAVFGDAIADVATDLKNKLELKKIQKEMEKELSDPVE